MKTFLRNRLWLVLVVVGGMAWFFLSSPAMVLAHGVVWEMSTKPLYGVVFSFSDGSPMAFSDVEVFGPDDETKVTQSGKTDNKGNFAFIPSGPGKWLVTSNDGAGHLARAEVVVTAPSEAKDGQESLTPVHTVNMDVAISKAVKPFKMGLVISVLLNFALIVMVARRKKS